MNIYLGSLEPAPEHRCVVRLRTTRWYDGKSLYLKQTLSYLRRKCSGYNILEEDISNIGATEVANRFTNLLACADGIYEVVTCDEKQDWETGYIDDYNYKLIPFEE